MKTIDRVLYLMSDKNISAVKLCSEIGLAKNAISEWKAGRIKPSTEHVTKIAKYFKVSTDYLHGLTDDPDPSAPEGGITDDDIKFALYGEVGEITDQQFNEVKRLIQLQKERLQ
jgi:transcriptional regulator with XRE-family HTH domain